MCTHAPVVLLGRSSPVCIYNLATSVYTYPAVRVHRVISTMLLAAVMPVMYTYIVYLRTITNLLAKSYHIYFLYFIQYELFILSLPLYYFFSISTITILVTINYYHSY